VTTVVAKLLNMAQPDRAYFGQKDFQQLQVVRRMVRDLDMPVEIVSCPTVREPDGLAMSSRNRYLSTEERRAAPVLSSALDAARDRFEAGERDAGRLVAAARAALEVEPLLRADYLELLDVERWEPIAEVRSPAVVAVAARIGGTRLIDNTLLDPVQPAAPGGSK